MMHFPHFDRRFLRAFLLLLTATGLPILPGASYAQDAAQDNAEVKTEIKSTGTEAKPDEEGWISLFDGKTLGQWKVVSKYDFKEHGEVIVEDGRILLKVGFPATGIKWSGEFPKIDYELALEAMRVEGDDFFCGLTFPVGDTWLTLVCGGWGGQVTGLSNIDGDSAIDNETCTFQDYKNKQWYRVRVRVTKERIEAWLDDEGIVDFETAGHQLSLRWEVEPTQPLGIATWAYTTGALRNLRWRPLEKKAPRAAQD